MYSASYESTTKLISAAVCVFLIGGAIITGSVAAYCVAAWILAVTYACSPRGYIISRESVVVRRLIGNVRIPLSEIREVRAADGEDLRGCIRIFGNGGLFGYYGKYRTSKLGVCDWYVTRRSNAVILATGSKTVVLSPDDVNGFVAAVIAFAPPRAMSNELGSCSTGRRWNVIGSSIGILVILIGAGALLYSPGPPKYTLTSEGLSIHDRFYPVMVKAADVDVEHIRIVDISADSHWRLTSRTNGFGGLHYHAGWFRVAGGEKVRMYRADSRRLVLLPLQDEVAPVLIEVKQPETFIQEVKWAWR